MTKVSLPKGGVVVVVVTVVVVVVVVVVVLVVVVVVVTVVVVVVVVVVGQVGEQNSPEPQFCGMLHLAPMTASVVFKFIATNARKMATREFIVTHRRCWT